MEKFGLSLWEGLQETTYTLVLFFRHVFVCPLRSCEGVHLSWHTDPIGVNSHTLNEGGFCYKRHEKV